MQINTALWTLSCKQMIVFFTYCIDRSSDRNRNTPRVIDPKRIRKERLMIKSLSGWFINSPRNRQLTDLYDLHLLNLTEEEIESVQL